MADELRAKIRASVQKAMAQQRQELEARRRAIAERDADKQTKDRVSEVQRLDKAEREGDISRAEAQQHRQINLAPPMSERQSVEEMRAAQAKTQHFGERMYGNRGDGGYQLPTDAELYRMTTPPSMRPPEVPATTTQGEDGLLRDMTPEELQLAIELETYLHDQEIERELNAPLPPARAAASSPMPITGSDELGRPVRGAPLDDVKVNRMRHPSGGTASGMTLDQTREAIDRVALEGQLLSDERAKVPAAVSERARLGGEPGVGDLGLMHGSAGPELHPLALRTDPDGGRIDANDPRAFLESTIPARSGLAANTQRTGPATDNLSLSDQRAEVAEARAARSDRAGRTGLAATDDDRLARVKRGMEFMSAMRSMQPGMIDMMPRRRYG